MLCGEGDDCDAGSAKPPQSFPTWLMKSASDRRGGWLRWSDRLRFRPGWEAVRAYACSPPPRVGVFVRPQAPPSRVERLGLSPRRSAACLNALMALLLDASRNFKRQLTALNDFMLPCAAALWNLRWQVRGYLEESPSVTQQELLGRFLAGSGIGGANLPRFSVEHSWEQQREVLARLVLTNQVTLFEMWQSELPGLSDHERTQVPHTSAGTGRWNDKSRTWITGKEGWPDILDNMHLDPQLERCFPPTARSDEPIRLQDVDQLILAFKVFKEARNCLVHGGLGSLKGEQTCLRYSAFPPLRVSRSAKKPPLRVPQIRDGALVVVDFTMVTGFMAVLLAIVATTDAVLGVSDSIGGAVLEGRCNAVWPSGFRVSKNGTREGKVKTAMTGIRYPEPVDPTVLAALLQSMGVLKG